MEGGLFQWEGCSPRQRTSPAQSSRQLARLGAEKSSAQSPLSFVSPCRGKLRTLPCPSSPHANRLAGFARGPHRLPRTCRGKKRIRPYSRPRARWRVQGFRHRRKPWRRANSFRPSRLIFGAPGGPARWGANSARHFPLCGRDMPAGGKERLTEYRNVSGEFCPDGNDLFISGWYDYNNM